MKNIKVALKTTISLFFIVTLCCGGTAQETGINRINKEQKLYELSVVWKELSYNFANMDNCPDVNLDSLYREYMVIVQNTENDWEYWKSMNRFLCHFNSSHVYCRQHPEYFYDYLGFLLLTTTYQDNKILVENIGTHNADKIKIGDEIVMVNDMPVLDYLQEYSIPYIPATNDESKTIHQATFGGGSQINISLRNEALKFGMKTLKGIENVTIAYDKYFNPSPKDTAEQKKRRYLDAGASKHFDFMRENLFLEDKVNDFAFIRLTRCDMSFASFFDEHYDQIMQYGNLIIDVHYNEGGSSDVTWHPIQCLINNDTIYTYPEKTRVNNALYRAWASIKILLYEDKDVPEYHKENFYPYYYDTAFEEINQGKNAYPSGVPDSLRYKGNVYVIIGENNGSAGEYFVAMLSQNKDITFLGKKTIGAFGQPLLVSLPSGIEVLINTTKSYDFRGQDISSGFPPDYEFDFSEIFKINDQQEMLGRLIHEIMR
ncbi:MAG: hypothetical protein LBV02_01505 [Bacteroidales bacterium]|jgi:C-terminal processing protease CtpA/Prc|nr:hypothetical protein [Bacteroidales bacterium]